MATPKIVLFYVFIELPDPQAIMHWQRCLAELAGVKGRIIISPQGINATVGGDISQVKTYVRGLRSYPPFSRADVKWSDGLGDDFPKLSVKIRPELVTFGVPEEIVVTDEGIHNGGEHLKPWQLHELIDSRGQDVVFFDGRNSIESKIGRFRNAITPQVETTREFTAMLDSGEFDDLKDRPIVTYCTGGVRCEVLSAMMKNRGFKEVYQLDGGIVRYGEHYGDQGLWEGSLYVFDKRMQMKFTDQAAVISRCEKCGTPTSRVVNYPDPHGRVLTVLCTSCSDNE